MQYESYGPQRKEAYVIAAFRHRLLLRSYLWTLAILHSSQKIVPAARNDRGILKFLHLLKPHISRDGQSAIASTFDSLLEAPSIRTHESQLAGWIVSLNDVIPAHAHCAVNHVLSQMSRPNCLSNAAMQCIGQTYTITLGMVSDGDVRWRCPAMCENRQIYEIFKWLYLQKLQSD